jgi:hypothetical protein
MLRGFEPNAFPCSRHYATPSPTALNGVSGAPGASINDRLVS